MGVRQDFINWLTVNRTKPNKLIDGSDVKSRAAGDGSAYVQNIVPSKQVLVEEGSYFTTTNPTPSTAIAYGSAGTQATFSDTVPFIQIINTGTPGDVQAPIIYPDFLKLIQNGTAPASTTSVHYATKLDNGFRAATAGTPVVNTPVGSNMNISTIAPAGRVITHSGAVATIPAASGGARLNGRGQLKGGPTLNLDEYSINWGSVDPGPTQAYLTTVSSYSSRATPCGIGPGQSLTIYLWFLSGVTNPFSYEFEFGHWERA